MKNVVPLVVALIMSLGAHAEESETVLYERLGLMASEVISEYLNGSICSPGPNLAEKQAELAEAISQATPGTGPFVLEIAVMANSLSDVQRLREGGALPLNSSGTMLHTAAMFSGPSMLEYWVGEGFDLEDTGSASGPALLVAVTTGNIENIGWLIANGANIHAMDTSGLPVIGHALICEDQGLVDLLLDAGAVPDSRTREAAQRLGIFLGSN